MYGAYIATSYNSTANAQLCAHERGLRDWPAVAHGCDNNWQYWNVGTRTQFNVDSQTYIGLDMIYTNLNRHRLVRARPQSPATGTQPAGLRTVGDQSAWIGGVPLPPQLLSLIV